MSTFPPFLGVVLLGLIIGTILLVVGAAKTVHHHGWGKQTWAPPAIPWFVASMAVLLATLVGGLLWASTE